MLEETPSRLSEALVPIQLNAQPLADFDRPIDVLEDCHRRIERFLRMLQAVVMAATNDGRMTEDAADALQVSLRYFRNAAPKHTADEEESLFPRMRATGDPRVAKVLAKLEQLEQDHVRAKDLHAIVDELGMRWLHAGALSREELASMGDTLAELREIYVSHIDFEDSVVFHLARDVLGADELVGLAAEMKGRRGQ